MPKTVEELPEEVQVIETVSEDGIPKKKKIRTRTIKKIKGDKQEVTTIQTIEEDDKRPQITATITDIPLLQGKQPTEIPKEKITQERLKKRIRLQKPAEDVLVQELPERKSFIFSKNEDGTPTKTVIKTKIIKKTVGDKQEITKIQIVEEFEKVPVTTVTVQEFDKPFPEIPDETVTPVIELPQEESVAVVIDDVTGLEKKVVTKKRIIKKPKGKQIEQTEIKTVEEEGVEPEFVVTITEEDNKNDDIPQSDIIESLELPEEVTVIQGKTTEGKPKKTTVKTRSFKKRVGDMDEITKIQFVDDQETPYTTVHIEEIHPQDEVTELPVTIEELPEEITISEITTHDDKKPKKKTIKTRTFKKDQSPQLPEVYQIQTIEEEGKEPISIVRVVSDDTIADIIDIRSLDDDKTQKPKKPKHSKHKTQLKDEETPKLEDTEKPVYITTFKSVQGEDGQPIIQTENKKLIQEEGFTVEEVLSDTEYVAEPQKTNVEIVEVNEVNEEDNKDYTITEPDDGNEDTQYTPDTIKKQKPKKKKPKFDQIDESPEEIFVEYLPEEVSEIQEPTEEGTVKIKTVKKRKIKKTVGDQEQIIEVVTTKEEGKDEESTVVLLDENEEPMQEEEKPVDVLEEKPKKKKKKPVKKVKKNELDEYIQMLIEQEIPKTVLQKYERVELQMPERARRGSSYKPQKADNSEYNEEDFPFHKFEIIETQPEIFEREVVNEEGTVKQEVVKKRKIRLQKEEEEKPEDFIEIVETQVDGQSEFEVSVVVFEAPEETAEGFVEPIKKKKIKKMKKDDLDAYIQFLIEQEIPKTELEMYEKTELGKKKKAKKSKPKLEVSEEGIFDVLDVKVTEEDITEKPKTKKKKPKQVVEKEAEHEEVPEDTPERFSISVMDSELVEEETVPEEAVKQKPKKKLKQKLSEETPVTVEEVHKDVEVVVKEDEVGKIEEHVITRRKIKKTKGHTEYIVEVIETQVEGQPESEITIIESEETQPNHQTELMENVPKKKKTVKKVKKEHIEQYIISVVEEQILRPETVDKQENEQFEEIEEAPEEQPDLGDVVVEESIEEKPEDATTIKEKQEYDALKTEKKKPKKIKKVTVVETDDKKELETHPEDITENIAEEKPEVIQDIDEFSVEVIEEHPKKPKKIKKLKVQDSEVLEEEHQVQVVELAPEIEIKEISDESGEKKQKTTKKRKIRKQEGDKEYLIEIVESQVEGQPEADVTMTTTEMTQPDEESPEVIKVVEKIKKKKVKKDELQEYIQKLIEQEIPKTELETYEKIDVDGKPKKVKKSKPKKETLEEQLGDLLDVSVMEEIPEKPQEKKKKKSPVEKIEVTEEAPEEYPEKWTVTTTESENREEKKIMEEAPEVKPKRKLKPKIIKEVPVTVEEISKDVEIIVKEDEEGKIQEHVVTTRKIKKKKGPKEYTIEVIETQVEGQPESEITIIESEQEQPGEEISVVEKAPKKKKITRKINKDKAEQYIINVIEEEAPENIILDEDEILSSEVIEEVAEVQEPSFKITTVVEDTAEVAEGDEEKISEEIEETLIKKIKSKKPKKVKIIDSMLNEEPEELIEDIIKIVEEEKQDEEEQPADLSIKILEKQRKKLKKPLKAKPQVEEDVVEEYRIRVQELEPEVEVKNVIIETGETKKQIIKKRKIKKQEGDKEYVIEIIETQEEGQPEADITMTTTEVIPAEEIEAPEQGIVEKVKKKKVKKDDLDAYIQSLIEMEIPKTELEKYEKIDVDGKPKKAKIFKPKKEAIEQELPEALDVTVTEEEVPEMPKKKKTKKKILVEEPVELEEKPEKAFEEFTIKTTVSEPSEIIQEEEVKVEEVPEKEESYEVTEELPISVEEVSKDVEIILQENEEGESKKKIITKRKIKKNKGHKEYTIEVIETQVEGQPESEITIIESEEPKPDAKVDLIEETPKKTRKTKKVKKELIEQYIISVIEEQPTKQMTFEEEELAPGKIIDEVPELQPEFDMTVVEETMETTHEEEDIPQQTEEEANQVEKKKVKRPKKIKVIESEAQETPISESEIQVKNVIEEKPEIIETVDDFPIKIVEEEPKKPKKTKKPKHQKEEEVFETYNIRITELAPEIETKEVIDEEGETKKQTIRKRKIKKQEGPKEYIIEIVETQEEGQPEADVIMTTTEVPSIEEVQVPEEPLKVKVVEKIKKKKIKKDDLHDYIQQLIEQEIPKTELEKYEKVEIDETPKKVKKIKKKPIVKEEIIDGLPVKVTEYQVSNEEVEEDVEELLVKVNQTIEEIKPKDDEEYIISLKEEQVKPTVFKEETVSVCELDESKPKKKPKKNTKTELEQQPEEITEYPVDVSEIETPSLINEIEETKPKKKTKKPKKHQDAKITITEFEAPLEEQQPFEVEVIDEETSIVKEQDDTGIIKEKTIRKRKIKKTEGPKEEIFEISETTEEGQPKAEVSVVLLEPDDTKPQDADVTVKPTKKTKKVKKEDIQGFIMSVVETAPEEEVLVEEDKPEEKPLRPKKSKIRVTETSEEEKIEKPDDYPVEETPEELQPEKIDDDENYSINVQNETITEIKEKPKKSKKPKQPKPSEADKEEFDNYTIKVEFSEELPIEEVTQTTEETSQIEEETPVILQEFEEYKIKIEEIEATQEVKQIVDEEGKTKKQTISKRIIKKQKGPKEEIIEIVEVQDEGAPSAEITVTSTEIPVVEEEGKPEEPKKKKKTTKKIKKDDIDDYIQKLIEQEIPKTELEKYEKVDIEETPKKPRKKSLKEDTIKIDESQPVPEVEVPIEEVTEVVEETPKKPKKTKKPDHEIKIIEEISHEPEEEFQVTVKELQEEVETQQVPDEAGVIKEKKITKRKVKQQIGPKEVVLEIVEIQDKDTGDAEITVTTSEAPIEEEVEPEEKVVKKKKTKKVKKDDLQDYIKKLIEEEIPKTELDTYEKIETEEKPRKTKKKHKAEIQVTTEEPLQEPQELHEDTEIKLIEQEPIEKIEEFETKQIEETKPKAPKKALKQKIKVIEEDKPTESVPEAEIEVIEESQAEVPLEEQRVFEIKEIEETQPPEDTTFEVSVKEKETPKVKEKKPKKLKVKEVETPESYEIKVNEYVAEYKEAAPVDTQVQVEEIETKSEVKEVQDADGITHKETTTRRKIKRQEGPKEEVIEIIEIQIDDQPEADITVISTEMPQPDEPTPEKPKAPKKKTKKVKKDDLDDYIQKLIEQEIPKTELEKYEKMEFETVPKVKPEEEESVVIKEESPVKEEEKPAKKKPKPSKKPQVEEEYPFVEISVKEEEPEQPIVEIIEDKPAEVKVEEVINEKGQPKQQVTTTRTMKKKKGDKESTLYIVTVQEEDKPDAVISIIEDLGEEPVPEEIEVIEEKPLKPTSTKPKKTKKTTKTVKTNEIDDYIQKLIEQEIPKTELEQYEKFDLPLIEEPKIEDQEQPEEKPKEKKKSKKPKPVEEVKTIEIIEEPIVEEKPSQITETLTLPETQPEETTDTEHITPQQEESKPDTTDYTTKVTKQKPTKKTKDTTQSETSVPVEEHKDFEISVIEEEAPEKIIEEEYPEYVVNVKVTEEIPEQQESIPIEVVEEIPEEEKQDKTEPVTTKKKKKTVKKPVDDHDDIIKALLEQEVEKTVLEKYEKIDIEKPKKEKPKVEGLVPTKIERVEHKPQKMVIVEAAEIPQMVKLKQTKRKEKPVEEDTSLLPKFKLKSRIVYVEYPPELLIPKFTDINAVRANGDLSRNIEEAEELLKFKPKKFKKLKKIKDDREKVDLEKYEKYVSSSEEEIEVKPYEKPEKVKAPEEPEQIVEIKLGKGKKKPIVEEQPESVTLKKTPSKPKEGEVVTEKTIKKEEEVVVKDVVDEAEQPQYHLEPFEPVDFEQPDYIKEDLEEVGKPEVTKKEKKQEKPKHKRKEKSKPEQEMEQIQIVPGIPKDEEDQPEETVKFRIPESEAPEEQTSEIKLKPVKKIEEDKPEIEAAVIPKEEEKVPEEKSILIEPEVKEEKPKKKPKKEKVKEVQSEKGEERTFEISVAEQDVIEETPVEEKKPKKVKVKESKPEDQPVSEIEVITELPEKQKEPSYDSYEISVTETEAPEIPEEFKVKVTESQEKEVTFEEVVEEKVVTRRKKPKPEEKPENFIIKLKEPASEKEEIDEPIQDATFKIKNTENVPEETEVEVQFTAPQPKEENEVEVVVKKKKPKKKPVEEEEAKLEVNVEEIIELPVEHVDELEVVEEKVPEKQPESYKFKLTETEPEKKQQLIIEEKEEVEPIPEPLEEKIQEDYKTYDIKTIEFAPEIKPQEPEELPEAKVKRTKKEKVKPVVDEIQEVKVLDQPAENVVEVKETEPEEVLFQVKKKVPKEEPEEFEAKVVLTSPKEDEQPITEAKIKQKKPKKPKVEEEEAVLEVKIVESHAPETAKEEDIVVEVTEHVPEEPKKKVQEIQKITAVETQPAPKEEPFYEVAVIEEEAPKVPEEETPIQEVKVVEEDVREVQIEEVQEVKVVKKKPKKLVQKEEEAPEATFSVKKKKPEEPEEVQAEVILSAPKPEEVEDAEVEIKQSKPKEPKPLVEEAAVLEVKVIDIEPELMEEISEEVNIVKKKSKKPVVEEIEETPQEFKVKLVKDKVQEEVLEQEFTIKPKIKPRVQEEPEAVVAEFKLPVSKTVEEVTEDAQIKMKKPKKKVKDEAAAELKVKVLEEQPYVGPAEEIIIQEEEEAPYVIEEPEEEEEIAEHKIRVLEEGPQELVEEIIEEPKESVPEEKVQEEKFKLPKKKKAVVEVTEEPMAEITLVEKKPAEEVTEDAEIKVKKPKKPKKEESAADFKITIVEEFPQAPQLEEVVEIEEVIEQPKEGEKKPDEIPKQYEFKLREIEPEESPEQADFKVKPKKVVKEEEEQVAEVKLKAEQIKVEEEQVEEKIVVKKPKKPKKPVEETFEEASIKLIQPVGPEEEQITEVTIKPKKPKEVQDEEVSVEMKLPKQKTEDTPEEALTLKKKKKPKRIEEAADELEIKKEFIIERPIEVEEEEIVEEAVIKRRQPKLKPTIEDLDEEEVSMSLKKPRIIDEGVEGEATVTKKRPVRSVQDAGEESAELVIKKLEEYDETEDVEEFVISKKPKPMPKQITDIQDQEYTIKKLKRRKKSNVEIPEFTDVENVTFRAKSTRTKEDVDQEFNIDLDSYAEEEISMSSKVKVKRPIKKTYSEAADEAQIKIIQDYDDGEEPIIEEIIDSSDGEDNTMYDVEEPEEFQAEELPPDEVEFKLKPKSKPKPRYSVQHEDGEEILLAFKPKRQDDVTYDEDSLTFHKKRKTTQQIFNEDAASLNITREAHIEETDGEENVMYSICNYIADNDEAINLVEGEKVYVVGRHSSEWWFIRKNLTAEEGWVPAQYLMEPTTYSLYVQKKLHEKIDKLPVFERPGPDEKAMAPRFIEKLQPIHTPDGYTVQFEAKVEGVPRPQIAWFRQTAIIKPSQDFQMYYDEDNVATLIIREVFPEDAGMFTCVAKNSAGFASTTTELVVETPLSDHGSDATGMSRKSMSRESSLADILEGIPPTFSRKPRAQYVDEGQNVILECRLVAVPEPDIVWTFNGEEVVTEKNVKVATESDMHMYCSIIHITKVKKSQEGVYEVIATNREGESRLPIVLKVKTDEKEPPQILEPLRNMIIREGESAVLTTQIVGNPPPKITWYKDGKPIKANTKSEKDTHTLTLISPKLPEKGEYTVKAVNPLGSVETTAYLSIEEAASGNAEPPLFVERFQEQSVPQKGTIYLTAKVTGNPVPEVSWLFNNNPLEPSKRVQLRYDGEIIELTITDANPETDSGDYKCIASNPVGNTSHGARVIVEVDEVSFTKKLKKTISIEESQSLTLECETSHVVSTKWFFNNKELSGMDHRVVVEDGKVHKLFIKTTNLRDAGNYVCKVKNKETHSSVEVLQRKPEFIRPLQDYEVKEKDDAFFEVEISSDAAEVTWIREGEKLTTENKRFEFVKEGKIRKLIIRESSIHDEGEFTCVLEDQECTAELIVIELPPQIIRKMEDVTVTKGESATFEIELTKGDALVKWFKNGKELQFSEHIQLSIDGKCQMLKIFNSEFEDASEYACQVGEQTSKAKLVVEEPMVNFTVKLPDVILATKSSDAEFVCELSQPDVDVTWYKKGKKIAPNKKHDVYVEGTVRRLIIHDADDDDAGEISCNARNVTTTSKLCVEEIKTAPIIISDKEQTVKVKENDDVTMTIKFSGKPQPEATWSTSKTVVKKSNRATPAIDEASASLTIRKVVEEDEDEYTVKLKNPIGEAEASINLVIMRPPKAPGSPQPLEVMHDSITLYWKAPEDDGKSEILEYILEYQDVKEQKWTEIRKIKDTTYTLTKLQVDSEYIFRAIAVNEVGPSPPSPLSPTIRLVAEKKTEKPTVQQPLQDITSELEKEVTLTCVFGGIPEPKISWKKNGKTIESTSIRYENRVSKYTIEKTTIETEATYTCIAENEVGTVETSCKLTIREKPTIDIDEKYIVQKLKTGNTLTIPAKIRGYPVPQITWHKETTEITTTKRTVIETIEISSTVTITKLTREDSGRYKVTATNLAGSTSTDITVKVIDKPQRPNSLEIKELKKDSIKLEWTPPVDDGGLEVTKYILEKCDIQNNVWMKVAEMDKSICSYSVQKLAMNSQYMFRVYASNPIGVSEPIESEPVTIARKMDKPTPPREPLDVCGMTETSFTLSWEPPESDGGSKIIEYIVEIKEVHETVFRLLGNSNGNVTNIFVSNVIKDKAYNFRIFAKNEVGISEALETEDKIIVGRRIIRPWEKVAPPSPPQNLRAPDVTSRSVTLDWEVPISNGGSELTGYVIEKRSSTSTKWTKVVTLDAHCLQYTIENLKEKCEYTFRVFAENSVGLSIPVSTESISLKTHATVPSPPTGPLEARVIAANAHIFEWGIPESDGGAPLLGYNIAIRDLRKTMWIEVGRVPPDLQRFQIKDLQENHEYMIRIFARNEIGLSEPLESDEPYKVITTGQEMLPDEPRTEMTGMSTDNTSSWLRDHNMDADIHSYARAKLLRKDEYFFRIFCNAGKLFKGKSEK